MRALVGHPLGSHPHPPPSLSPAGSTRARCLAWAASASTWPSSLSSTTRWSSSSTRCGKQTERRGPGWPHASATTARPQLESDDQGRSCRRRQGPKSPARVCGPGSPPGLPVPPPSANPAAFIYRNKPWSRLNYWLCVNMAGEAGEAVPQCPRLCLPGARWLCVPAGCASPIPRLG